MPFKKLGVTLVALSLGLAAAVAVPMSASAHTATLTASVACTTSTGDAVVTWKLENDYNEVLTVETSDLAAIPSGTTVSAAASGTTSKSFTQTIKAPADGKTVTANLTYSWAPDNFKQSGPPVTATVPSSCTVPSPPTTCTTAVWKIASGDATKPWEGDQVLVSSEAADCGDLTHPVPPTTCGTAYQIDSYYDGANTTALLADGPGKSVLHSPGHPAEDLVKATTVQNDACALPETAAPAFTYHDVCGTADDTFTPTAADHVVYSTPVDNRVDGVGTITVTATPATGYAFPAGTKVDPKGAVELSQAFTNDACPSTAAPAFTFNDVCGTADDTFTATAADHVVYSTPADNRVDGVGTITVTATPATGYAFPAGTVVDSTGAVVLSHAFTNDACAVTPPVTPPVDTPPAVSPPVVTPPAVTPPAVTPPKVDAPRVTKPASTITKVSPPKVTTPKVSSTSTTPTELASTGIGDSTYISALVALAAVILGAAVLGITVRRRRHADAE